MMLLFFSMFPLFLTEQLCVYQAHASSDENVNCGAAELLKESESNKKQRGKENIELWVTLV